MSDTPRTDALLAKWHGEWGADALLTLTRQLERELNAARPEAMPHEDPVRQAVKRHVRATAAHIKENAEALKKYDWEGNEARCRELCAMYLEEIALSMDMGDKLSALSKRLGMNSGGT